MRRVWLERGLALILGLVFIYASVEKILNPADFARIIYRYRIVGPTSQIGFLPANLVAVILPWLELLVGLLLIVGDWRPGAAGVWRRDAARIAAVLLVGFLVVVIAAWARGINVESCGCFQVQGRGRGIGWPLIAMDAALLAVALWLGRRIKTNTPK